MGEKRLSGFLFFQPGIDPDAIEFAMTHGRAVGVLVRERDGWRGYLLCGDHQHESPRACVDIAEARRLFVRGFVQRLGEGLLNDDSDNDASEQTDPSEVN